MGPRATSRSCERTSGPCVPASVADPMPEAAVELDAVSVRPGGSPVLEDVDLTIPPLLLTPRPDHPVRGRPIGSTGGVKRNGLPDSASAPGPTRIAPIPCTTQRT